MELRIPSQQVPGDAVINAENAKVGREGEKHLQGLLSARPDSRLVGQSRRRQKKRG